MISITDGFMHYSTELKANGTVLLPSNLIFSSEELIRLQTIQSSIPEERVSNGDADDDNGIFVRRIVTDKAGEFPMRVNQPNSDLILNILDDDKRQLAFAEILGANSKYYIRRVQAHRLVTGSHIGLHLDAESNPHNEFSVIIHFGEDFEGGEFVVYPDDATTQVFRPKPGTVLVTTCKFRHEVRKVLSNERNSLVYFYSTHAGRNQRNEMAPCSRPGCRWCGSHLRSHIDNA